MAETSMMSINRYRLRHLVNQNNVQAKRVSKLLEHPDRLLGMILVGNNFANILASAIATIVAERTWGETGIFIATIILTVIVLIFSEIAPKVFAASFPQKTAFRFSWILTVLAQAFYPVVWFLNLVVKGIFKVLRITIKKNVIENLSQEELSTVVKEAGSLLLTEHQDILIKALELQKITVNDIMIPIHEIQGIDLENEWDTILEKIMHSPYPRLPVYYNTIEKLQGILYIRNVIASLQEGVLDREVLLNVIKKPYFLPEGTPLLTQLINFKHHKQKIGFVVDEYGTIQGLATLEDILEELVGEFTTNLLDTSSREIFPQNDGSYIVDGGINVRELNRMMDWDLPTGHGPKTLSGLMIDYLEMIPPIGTTILLERYPIEVIQIKDNMVKTARIFKKII